MPVVTIKKLEIDQKGGRLLKDPRIKQELTEDNSIKIFLSPTFNTNYYLISHIIFVLIEYNFFYTLPSLLDSKNFSSTAVDSVYWINYQSLEITFNYSVFVLFPLNISYLLVSVGKYYGIISVQKLGALLTLYRNLLDTFYSGI